VSERGKGGEASLVRGPLNARGAPTPGRSQVRASTGGTASSFTLLERGSTIQVVTEGKGALA
jgi:hypothetical protein